MHVIATKEPEHVLEVVATVAENVAKSAGEAVVQELRVCGHDPLLQASRLPPGSVTASVVKRVMSHAVTELACDAQEKELSTFIEGTPSQDTVPARDLA
jgi:hypothetical protein